MVTTRTLSRLNPVRAIVWARENRTELARKTALTFVMACATALAAQIRVPIPGTPVPVTGQVFAVLLAGLWLGSGWGVASQVLYVVAGAMHASWFAGGSAALFGPTGGYLIGFAPAALLTGWLGRKAIAARSFTGLMAALLASVAIIYFFGAVQFAAVMRTGPAETIALAVWPFVAVDTAKALLLALGAWTILLRRRHNV